MSSKMLKFVNVEKAMPQKREAEKRKVDFDEILVHFSHLGCQQERSYVFGWNSYLRVRLRIDYCSFPVLVLR